MPTASTAGIRPAAAAGALLLAAWALACGKAAVTAEEACADLAAVQCMKRSACSDGADITRAFGDMGTCLARERIACLDALAAPATGQSPARVETCVAAFAGYSCADFAANQPPAECAPTGARALGGTCAFNAQCASGFCARAANAQCGVCATPPAAGDPCDDAGCGHGLTCIAAGTGSVCRAPGALAAPCDPSDPCGAGLSCAGDTAALGTCQSAVVETGARCGGNLPDCDGALGLHCGGGDGRCLLAGFVTDGMPCGATGDDAFAECTQGGCYTASGAATAGQPGTCKADAPDGAPCDAVLGPGCTPPARCVATSGTAGRCTIPLGPSCG